MIRTPLALAMVSAGLCAVLPQLAAASPEIPVPQTRLIAAGAPDADGRYRLGLEVVLPAGWHTYWRDPGEAGVPPRFATDGSANLAGLTVRYPAPERYFDGFSTSNVYHGAVVFPLTATAAAPSQPVALALAFDYGICREICVPVSATFEALLDPAAPHDAAASAVIDSAEGHVPMPEAAAAATAPRLVSVTPSGTAADPVVDLAVAAGADGDLAVFAEGPAGWYLSAPEPLPGGAAGETRFRLSLAGRPKGAAIEGAVVRFTLVGPGGAVEAERRLDGGAALP